MPQKAIQTLSIQRKFKNHAHKIWHKSFSMIESAGIKNWFLLVNELIKALKAQSFLSATCFSDFSDKIKYAW